MKIKKFTGGLLESNGYVMYQDKGGSCYVIDPGSSSKTFIKYIEDMALDLKGILLTHHHSDHVAAVKKLSAHFECPVYIHREDADYYRDSADVFLEDGMLLDLDGEAICIIHTPGHTAGGVCFYSEKSKVVFTGDTIFDNDLGRTDLPGGSEKQLVSTCREIIDKWSNEIFIYPGHGPSCNMKKVRKYNMEFIERVR